MQCIRILERETERETIFKVTIIEENAKESNGISSRANRAHSSDSGPGEKSGDFSLARKMM